MPVLIRTGALGDVVLVGSVTAALGDCVVGTSPHLVPLVSRFRGVREARPWREVVSEPDVVDLQASLRTRRALFARGGRRVRKQSIRRRLWLAGLAGPRPPVPVLYGRAVGVHPVSAPWIEVRATPRRALGLAPGASVGPKRWSASRFAELARAWDGPVIVFGGPDEAARVAEVVGESGARSIVERGFDRTLDALAEVAVMVSADSGLMHLAGATGARVVALFGPTHPDDGFFVYPGEVVQRDVACRPCGLHRIQRCHTGHHRCMDLPVAAVLAAVRRQWP